jgi:hypothetical protein
VVILDTDVLLLAFAFQRDPHQADNAAFLECARNARHFKGKTALRVLTPAEYLAA